jgi:hypothetical protein
LLHSNHGIIPDYSITSTVTGWFCTATKAIIEQSQSLEILTEAMEADSQKKRGNLSSWVPNFLVPKKNKDRWRRTMDRPAQASQDESAQYTFQSNVLWVRVIEIATVAMEGAEPASIYLNASRVLRGHLKKILPKSYFPTGESVEEAVSETMSLITSEWDNSWTNSWANSSESPIFESGHESMNESVIHQEPWKAEWTFEGATPIYEESLSFFVTPEVNSGSEDPKASKSGKQAATEVDSTVIIGRAPQRAMPTDELCVIFGASAPWIIRKIDGDHNYILIGEAYLHGYMHGKAVEEWKLGKRKDKWINLHWVMYKVCV